MKKDIRLEMLKEEYMMLQGFYDDIDERCITIKGWSITVGLAALGAGFVYSGYLFLGAVLSGLLFWYLEGHWRGLSFFFSRRIMEIEEAIREDKWESLTPLQVYASWERSYQSHGPQTRRYMLRWATLLPHGFISLAGLVLAGLRLSGIV